jgi:hypothetical protein
MLNATDVRRLALALPEVTEAAEVDQLSFAVASKSIAWTYLERVQPKAPRRPRLDVLAVRCPIEKKELLIEAVPEVYFDDDHYRGYPAVLVRLTAVDEAELAALLRDAWTIQAPKRLRKVYDDGRDRRE